MKWFTNLFKKKSKISNRKVTKARFLYLYFIFGSTGGLIYFTIALFFDLPKIIALTPLVGLFAFIALKLIIKNWRLIWLFISDMERGRLLLFLNKNTHFEEAHKMKLINWVYLKKKTIRRETRSRIINNAGTNGVTKEEMRLLSYTPVFCPQQLIGDQSGFNKALLVNALIYAHQNIQVLDDELRRIMELTDEHILSFNINTEAEKCKDRKYQKLMNIGKERAKEKTDEPSIKNEDVVKYCKGVISSKK